jgi:hypothetical protein
MPDSRYVGRGVPTSWPGPPGTRYLSNYFRSKRSVHLRQLIEKTSKNLGHCRIADLGGEGSYWNSIGLDFLRQQNVHINIINLDSSRVHVADPTIFTVETADACSMTHVRDNSFDLVHANSVIEHVGDWDKMCAFATEVRRIGRRYLVQTPNFWFPIEPHFFFPAWHWLPEPTRIALLRRRGFGWRKAQPDLGAAVALVNSTHLLDASMLRYLFPDARLVRERICGLTKSLTVIRA